MNSVEHLPNDDKKQNKLDDSEITRQEETLIIGNNFQIRSESKACTEKNSKLDLTDKILSPQKKTQRKAKTYKGLINQNLIFISNNHTNNIEECPEELSEEDIINLEAEKEIKELEIQEIEDIKKSKRLITFAKGTIVNKFKKVISSKDTDNDSRISGTSSTLKLRKSLSLSRGKNLFNRINLESEVHNRSKSANFIVDYKKLFKIEEVHKYIKRSSLEDKEKNVFDFYENESDDDQIFSIFDDDFDNQKEEENLVSEIREEKEETYVDLEKDEFIVNFLNDINDTNKLVENINTKKGPHNETNLKFDNNSNSHIADKAEIIENIHIGISTLSPRKKLKNPNKNNYTSEVKEILSSQEKLSYLISSISNNNNARNRIFEDLKLNFSSIISMTSFIKFNQLFFKHINYKQRVQLLEIIEKDSTFNLTNSIALSCIYNLFHHLTESNEVEIFLRIIGTKIEELIYKTNGSQLLIEIIKQYSEKRIEYLYIKIQEKFLIFSCHKTASLSVKECLIKSKSTKNITTFVSLIMQNISMIAEHTVGSEIVIAGINSLYPESMKIVSEVDKLMLKLSNSQYGSSVVQKCLFNQIFVERFVFQIINNNFIMILIKTTFGSNLLLTALSRTQFKYQLVNAIYKTLNFIRSNDLTIKWKTKISNLLQSIYNNPNNYNINNTQNLIRFNGSNNNVIIPKHGGEYKFNSQNLASSNIINQYYNKNSNQNFGTNSYYLNKNKETNDELYRNHNIKEYEI